jgi:hypothetical protein
VNGRDDPDNHAKVLATTLPSQSWGVIHYPLTEPSTGWVGLSEIVAHGDFVYFIERDNQLDDRAVTKLITRVPMSAMDAVVALGRNAGCA